MAEALTQRPRLPDQSRLELPDALAGHPQCGSRNAQRRDHLAAAAAHRRSDRGQAKLELVDGGGEAPSADILELGPQLLGVGDRVWRVPSQRPRRHRSAAEGHEHLAVGRAVVLHRAPEPLAGAQEVPALHLRHVLDAVRRREREVDRLPAERTQRLQRRLREFHQAALEQPALRHPEDRRTRPQPPSLAVLLNQTPPLECGEQARGRALGDSAGRSQVSQCHRFLALQHPDQEVGAAVHRGYTVCASLKLLFHARSVTRASMFVNALPRYEILSEDAMDVLDRGWRRLVSEIGVEFLLPEAVELLRAAGQSVEDQNRVRFDPEFILEQVAKAPREFELQARNPERTAHIGGDHMVFSPVYGCPFIREGDVRREATLNDFRQLAMLSQAYDELDSAGGVICEPNDAPLDSRHLDMIYALQTLTDKIYMGNVVSGPNAADTIAMTSILFGGRDVIERVPATISLINCNSPLRWDDRMLDAQFEYCAAAQPVVLTPFLLMGAMSPVTIPAALVQQLAEALSGIALAQLIRPGCPVIFGSFLSNIDMQSGSDQL